MTKVFGLVTSSPSQMELIKNHCFGDCGKMGLFDYVNTGIGALAICREEQCPYLKKQLDVPYGETVERGDVIYLRSIQSPKETQVSDKEKP